MAKLCLREHFQFLHCVTSSASTFHHFDLHFSNCIFVPLFLKATENQFFCSYFAQERSFCMAFNMPCTKAGISV